VSSLPNWLSYHAASTPNSTALVAVGGRWTFAELNAWAASIGGGLLLQGVRTGDRAAVLMDNGPEYFALIHALMRIGAVLAPVNTRLSAAEIAWQLADCQASLLIHDRANADSAARAAKSSGVRTVAFEQSFVGELAVAMQQAREVDLAELQCIVYTSGTTGRPKGAMLTYGSHWWSAAGSAINLGAHRSDVWLLCLPMFHVGGLAILMRAAIHGVPVVVHRGFDAAALNAAIEEDSVTLFSAVAVMLRRMLRESGTTAYPSTLRAVLLGGGPAPTDLLEECARRGLPVLQTYGLTETASQAVTLSPSDAPTHPQSAGRPLLPTLLRIGRNEGAQAEPNEPGEILLRGPNVSPGYYRRPSETERAFRGGWFHTGDDGYLDDEGFLYVLDRRSDLIVTGGENVYPAEVEAALLNHTAVADAGVYGVPDPEWGSEVVAAVVLREDAVADGEALRAHVLAQIAGYKVPRRVHFVPELPRNAAGKLVRRDLRRQYG